jgi:hypothetical protein
MKRVVVPLHWAQLRVTGRAGQDDRTHPALCPVAQIKPRVTVVQPRVLISNGYFAHAPQQTPDRMHRSMIGRSHL